MNKQKVMEINKEFVKLVAENPELPIKVFINGECGDGDCWFVGEIYDCKVTEITEYRDKCYERDDFDWLKDIISDEVSPFIRIKRRPSNQTVTATLLLATVEELAISKE